MLRQIEWGLENGPVTKNGVLALFFSLNIYFEYKDHL